MALEIEKFSHVAMQVSNLEASIAFYHELLGLEMIFDRPYVDPRRPNHPLRVVGCVVGGTVTIEFMGDPERTREIDGSASPVLALNVADLQDTHARLLAAGVEPMMPPTEMEPGVFMIFVRDPDGRTIEFVEFSSGASCSAEFAKSTA